MVGQTELAFNHRYKIFAIVRVLSLSYNAILNIVINVKVSSTRGIDVVLVYGHYHKSEHRHLAVSLSEAFFCV